MATRNVDAVLYPTLPLPDLRMDHLDSFPLFIEGIRFCGRRTRFVNSSGRPIDQPRFIASRHSPFSNVELLSISQKTTLIEHLLKEIPPMSIELFIEKWSALTGSDLYPWSIWRDGRQVHHGQRMRTAEEAEQEGLHYCQHILREVPERVTRL